MAPLEMSKVITIYNETTIGIWLSKMQHVPNGLTLTGPIKLFVSFQYKTEADLKKANLGNYLKEIVATLILARVILNSQSINEIGIEKVTGLKQEVMIFLQES